MDKKEYDKITKEIDEINSREKELVIANMPTFERGVVEAALEREKVIWDKISEIFDAEKISPEVSFNIIAENQNSSDKNRPALACAGVTVSVRYLVSPMDDCGKDGHMPDAVLTEISESRQKKSELQRKLESV